MGLKDDKPTPLAAIVQWFKLKTPAELEAIESGGRNYWPDALKERRPSGLVEKPCMLRVPNVSERSQAYIMCNEWVAKRAKVDRKDLPISRERAEGILGPEAYDALHTAMLMSFAIREFTPPYAQMWIPENIIDAVDTIALNEMFVRLDAYSCHEDFRLGDCTQEEFEAILDQIVRTKTILPLAVFAGSKRELAIVRMAEELLELRAMLRSSSASSSTSTPD